MLFYYINRNVHLPVRKRQKGQTEGIQPGRRGAWKAAAAGDEAPPLRAAADRRPKQQAAKRAAQTAAARRAANSSCKAAAQSGFSAPRQTAHGRESCKAQS